MPVEKIWEDNNNEAGKRPERITVTLTGSNGENQTKTLNAQNNWKDSFTDLAKYDSKGNIITYTVAETVEGENAKFYQASIETEGNKTIFTNTFVPSQEKMDIPVEKIWQDNNNEAERRPESITVILKNKAGQVGEAKILNAENGWKETFKEVAKYDEKNDVIDYTIEETINGENAKFYIQEGKVAIVNGVYTITNRFQVPDEKITIPVEKIWEDGDNLAGKRPENIEVKIIGSDGSERIKTLNEKNNWKEEVEVAKYDALGKEINYRVEEITQNDFYTTTVEEYKVKNSIIQEKIETSVTVEKEWNDGDNKEGKRPGEITVVVKDGTKEVAEGKLNAKNGWKTTFVHLAKYDKTGAQITYTVEEKDYNNEYYSSHITGTQQNGYKITNTIDWDKFNKMIPVEKIWEDGDNLAGKRPENIEVKIIGSDGSERIKTLNEKNNWKEEVEVAKYDALGKEINYRVEEITQNDFYTTTVEEYKVKNSIIQEKIETSVTVEKEWNDGDNKEGKRPGEITVVVKDGTKEVAEGKLNAKNGWKTTFVHLAKYDKTGAQITYTVEEKDYNNEYYSSHITGTQQNGYKITNTINWDKFITSIPVEKKWEGDTEKVRPSNIKVVVKQGKEVVAETILGEVQQWKHTFENLPKYQEDGTQITYTVEEIEVTQGQLENYESKVEGYTITNTYLAPEIKVDKSSTTNETVVKQNGKETYIDYTITITNTGRGIAKNVVVKDNLPTGLSYVSSSEQLSNNAQSSSGKLEWNIARMEAGASKKITVKAKVLDSVKFGTQLQNIATVEGVDKPSDPVIHTVEGKVSASETRTIIDSTNIVLVIDVSNSMKNKATDGDSTSKIEAAKNAAIQFIQKAYPNKDQDVVVPIKVITFAGTASEVTGVATDYTSSQGLISEIRKIGVSDGNYGGTNMKAALEKTKTTIAALKQQYPNNKNTVIFLGDGEPTHPEKYSDSVASIYEDNYEYKINQLATQIKNAGTKIYTIGFGISKLSNDKEYVLCPYGASGCTQEHEISGIINKKYYHYISPRQEATRILTNMSSGSGYYYLSNNASDLVNAFTMIFEQEGTPVKHVETTENGVATLTLDKPLDTTKKIKVSINGVVTEYSISALPTGLTYDSNSKTFTWDVKNYTVGTQLAIICNVK